MDPASKYSHWPGSHCKHGAASPSHQPQPAENFNEELKFRNRGAAIRRNLPCRQVFYRDELWRPFRQSFGPGLARLFTRNNHIQIVAIDDSRHAAALPAQPPALHTTTDRVARFAHSAVWFMSVSVPLSTRVNSWL